MLKCQKTTYDGVVELGRSTGVVDDLFERVCIALLGRGVKRARIRGRRTRCGRGSHLLRGLCHGLVGGVVAQVRALLGRDGRGGRRGRGGHGRRGAGGGGRAHAHLHRLRLGLHLGQQGGHLRLLTRLNYGRIVGYKN